MSTNIFPVPGNLLHNRNTWVFEANSIPALGELKVYEEELTFKQCMANQKYYQHCSCVYTLQEHIILHWFFFIFGIKPQIPVATY